MSVLKAGDTISGVEATATVNINGEIHELFYAKKLVAKATKEKVDMRSLKKRAKQKKTVGWEGTGTLTIYKVTSLFTEMMIDYIKNGIDVYFSIVVTNDDPSSSIGAQTVSLLDCNLDEAVLASFDTESQVLEEEAAFTFTDADLLQAFTGPQ